MELARNWKRETIMEEGKEIGKELGKTNALGKVWHSPGKTRENQTK